MKAGTKNKQQGMTLIGLIFVLAIVGCVAVVAMQVVPSFIEYLSIKKAIVAAKSSSTNPNEIRTSFDKQAEIGYISSLRGKDLEISKNGDSVEVSFAYEKKLHLVGPASLLMEYEGTTANNGVKKARSVGE
jgi:type II secretory pathway pseudopilin PulG